MTDRLPAAVLWDMDGTLIDSEPYWVDAEIELVESWGGVWTHQDGLQCVGLGLPESARLFQGRGVRLEVPEIIDHLTDRVMARISVEVPFRPGARELLASVAATGVPMAMVTMSMRRMALLVADAIGADTFQLVVAGDDVSAHKPDPEPYLHAARELGVDVRDTIAIEDSAPGTASAVASGASVIAVPLHVPLPPSPAYTLWDGLAGRSVADLVRVHDAQRSRA